MSDLVTGPGIDLIHLGMGPDGHTASLFPNAPTLEAEPGVLVLATEDPNGVNPHPRLTLTLAAINSARLAVFTVAGASKAHAVAALRARATTCPPPASMPGGRCGWSTAPARRLPLDWPQCSPTPISCACPSSDLTALARVVRDERPRAAGHLLAQGLHPADHAVPGPLRLLHLRQGAGPADGALPHCPRRCWPSPGPARRPAATRPSSPWASGPRTALPRRRGAGSPIRATPRRWTTSRRCLPARPGGDRPAPPRQRRRPRRRPSSPRLRPVAASQGMMLESLAEGLDAHRGAPDKEPARRLATLEAAGELAIPFTTGILVGHRRRRRTDQLGGPARHRRSRTPATATCRRSSCRTSCPSRARPCAGPSPARPTTSCGPSRSARLVLPPEIHVQAPPEPLRRAGPAARRRHRRLGRRVARSPPTT